MNSQQRINKCTSEIKRLENKKNEIVLEWRQLPATKHTSFCLYWLAIFKYFHFLLIIEKKMGTQYCVVTALNAVTADVQIFLIVLVPLDFGHIIFIAHTFSNISLFWWLKMPFFNTDNMDRRFGECFNNWYWLYERNITRFSESYGKINSKIDTEKRAS